PPATGARSWPMPSLPILFHMTSVAPSSQGWRKWRAGSVPAVMPVAASGAGCPPPGAPPGAGAPPPPPAPTQAAPPPPRGHRPQPVARATDQVLVPRVGLVHDAQRHRRGGRLAARRAAVRFERVAEAAVGIAVGGHRVPHRRSRAVLEKPLEAAPVKHPGIGGDEAR